MDRNRLKGMLDMVSKARPLRDRNRKSVDITLKEAKRLADNLNRYCRFRFARNADKLRDHLKENGCSMTEKTLLRWMGRIKKKKGSDEVDFPSSLTWNILEPMEVALGVSADDLLDGIIIWPEESSPKKARKTRQLKSDEA